VVCTFKWHDQDIDFPKDLQAILNNYDWVHGHNFLRVHTSQWVDLDVTWDTPLIEYGFRALPNDWNGTQSFIGLQSMVERWDDVDVKSKKAELIATLTDEQRSARQAFVHELEMWIAL
jgi:hypothetical protein